jgi:hypothetical protein
VGGSLLSNTVKEVFEMTNSQPESNYPIGTLTIAELEALIVNIVQKVLRQEKIASILKLRKQKQ